MLFSGCVCSDQKAIDVDNRAHYVALRKRWEVLDKLIIYPDDDITDATPWYMESSDDENEEDDSNSCPPPLIDQELFSAARATDVCRLCGRSCDTNVAAGRSCGGGNRKNSPRCGGTVGDNGSVRCLECGVEGKGYVDGRVMRGTYPVTSSSGCGLCGGVRGRRCSSSGVLDQEGVPMLQVLELPSKVRVICYTSSCLAGPTSNNYCNNN